LSDRCSAPRRDQPADRRRAEADRLVRDGGEHEWGDRVGHRRVDLLEDAARLLDRRDEGDLATDEAQPRELREQQVAEGLGRDSRATGDEDTGVRVAWAPVAAARAEDSEVVMSSSNQLRNG